MNQNNNTPFSADKLAIYAGIAIQIIVMIWGVSQTAAVIKANIAELERLSEKLEKRLDDFEDRLRIAERELIIMKIMVERDAKDN